MSREEKQCFFKVIVIGNSVVDQPKRIICNKFICSDFKSLDILDSEQRVFCNGLQVPSDSSS